MEQKKSKKAKLDSMLGAVERKAPTVMPWPVTCRGIYCTPADK